MRFLVAALLLCASVANAEERYAFVGFGVNSPKSALTPELGSGASLNVGMGWPLAQGLHLEASAAAHESTESVFALAGSTWREDRSSWRAWSIGVAAVGELPITPALSLVGRAGLHLVDSTTRSEVFTTVIGSGVTTVTETRRSKAGIVPALAAGASYAFLPGLRARLMLERLEAPSGSGLDRARLVWLDLVIAF